MARMQTEKNSCLCGVKDTYWALMFSNSFRSSGYSEHKSTPVGLVREIPKISRQDDFMEPNCKLVIKTELRN